MKELREAKGLLLLDVHKKTKIDLSHLSRIENGKRLPTKIQVIQLAKLYKCDKEKILTQWLSDKILNEVQNEEYGLAALQVAEENIKYGKPISLFPELTTEKPLHLESRRYIGNKAKLTNWILETIKKEVNGATSFLDIFAGTASVSKSAFPYFKKVIINEILFSNNIIHKAFFQIGNWNRVKINSILQEYSNINPEKITENYFSKNFGGKFYEHNLSKIIGYIRQDIEDKKNELTEKEYNILLATLIYNIDKLANTVGHFDAYIKKPIRVQKLNLRIIEPSDFAGVEIYRENANQLARTIKADVAYIDPPYNSRQYSRFYHLYETLVKWDKPKLHGVALKPTPENMSVYCTVGAKDAFRDLVENLNVKHLAVSYNNTYNSKSSSSENKIKLEEIEYILNRKGKTKVFKKKYNHLNEVYLETLFITKNKS